MARRPTRRSTSPIDKGSNIMFMDVQGPSNALFGRLPMILDLHYNNPWIMLAAAMVVIGGVGITGLLTYFKLWGWLWREFAND